MGCLQWARTRLPLIALGFFLAVGSIGAQPLFDQGVTRVQYAGAPQNAIYAYSNGLFRSRDGGLTWVALHILEPGLPQPGISDILVNHSNPRVLYAFSFGAPARVWKTTDGGDHWTNASSGLPSSVYSFRDPVILNSTPETLYLLSEADVYVTRNGGASWSKRTTLPVSVNSLGVLPTIGFAAAQNLPGRLYYWSGRNLSRSDDDGDTWTRTNLLTGTGDAIGILDAAISPVDGNEIVVVGNIQRGQAVFSSITQVSTNGGQSYVERAQRSTAATLAIDYAGTFHYRGCCGDYCRSITKAVNWQCTTVGTGPRDWAFDPRSTSVIYYAESNGVSKSTDGGETRIPLGGTARPTLEKPAAASRIALAPSTTVRFTLPMRSVEHKDWKLPFQILGAPSWMKLSASSGETPTDVSATLDSSGLSAGTYSAELTLRSTAAAADTKIPITLVVTPVASGPSYSSVIFAGGGDAEPVGYSGDATKVRLLPSDLAADAGGNVYVATTGYTAHRIDPQGQATHIAGTGSSGSSGAGDGGPATAAPLGSVRGFGADQAGRVYWFETSRLRRIAGGNISTVLMTSALSGLGAAAGRLRPGPDGSLIWAANNAVFRFDPANLRSEMLDAGPGEASYSDVAMAPGGGYYVLDTSANRVFLLRNGSLTPVAGVGLAGFSGDGAMATEALLRSPSSLAVAPDGSLYIGDSGNYRVRVVTPAGTIYTIAGNGNSAGQPTGPLATDAPLNRVEDVVVGPGGTIFVAEARRIVKLTPAQPLPAISSGGFLHHSTGQPVVAAGGYFSLYGTNLAPSVQSNAAAQWPIRLNDVEVRIQDRSAPLFYVSPTQINGQVPYDVAPRPVTATVIVKGLTSAAVAAEVRRAAPGVLPWGENRAVAVNTDGGINGANGGVSAGQIVVVYMTGVGLVDGTPASGTVASAEPLPRVTTPYQVTIGGKPAEVLYLGLTPGQVGLAQANVVVPELPAGDHPIVVTVDGVASNAPLIQVR